MVGPPHTTRCPIAAGAGISPELSASTTSLNATERFGSAGVWSTSFLPAASLIQNLPKSVPMPSTAPSTSRFRSTPEASYNENLMEEEPLFNTKIGKAAMDRKPFKRFGCANHQEIR